MVLQALKTTGVRVATAQARRVGARRNMGGHAPAPEWTGIDKVVRGVFPQDAQLAGAILSGYGVLIGLGVLMSGGSSEPEAAPVQKAVATSVGSSDLPPSVESAEFDTFVESDAFTKFIESEENVNKYVSSLE